MQAVSLNGILERISNSTSKKSRLKTVEDMLVGTQMSIKEISNRMGYTDPCYLNKLFQQYHNMTPLQYRKKYCGTHLPISDEK